MCEISGDADICDGATGLFLGEVFINLDEGIPPAVLHVLFQGQVFVYRFEGGEVQPSPPAILPQRNKGDPS